MEILKDDERNILHFSRKYAKPGLPIEDLQQEGRLAVLEVTDPSHKYLAIRNAVQQARSRFDKHMSRHSYSDHLDNFDSRKSNPINQTHNADLLNTIIASANLSPREKHVLNAYEIENKTLQEIATDLNTTHPTILTTLNLARKKVYETGNSQFKEDVSCI